MLGLFGVVLSKRRAEKKEERGRKREKKLSPIEAFNFCMVDFSLRAPVCTFRLSIFGYQNNEDIPGNSYHLVIIRWHQKTFSFSRVCSEARRLPFPSVFG